MIYITEFPHQGPSKFWTANSRQYLVAVVCRTIEQRREGYDPQSYEDCIDYLGHDLRSLHVTELDTSGLSWSAQRLLERIVRDTPDTDKEIIRDFLEDGAALAASGFIDDDDLQTVEELHAWTKGLAA